MDPMVHTIQMIDHVKLYRCGIITHFGQRTVLQLVALAIVHGFDDIPCIIQCFGCKVRFHWQIQNNGTRDDKFVHYDALKFNK